MLRRFGCGGRIELTPDLLRVTLLIEYRLFRNSDPPQLAELWRSQASRRGLMQPMSAALLEQLVLSKPIFDREGMILATEGGKIVGFVHAGFGAAENQQALSTSTGVISMLMVRPTHDESNMGVELVRRSEEYLHNHGTNVLYAFGSPLVDPSYLGLYGGSELSGILDSDVQIREVFVSQGYREVSRSLVLHRDLARFRPLIDRRQMQIRRRTSLQVVEDAPCKNWWEACTFGGFPRTRFELQSRETGAALASVSFWNMEPLASTWGVHAAGLIDLEVAPAERRQGLATYLLGEAFRQLHTEGVGLVEVQIRNDAAPALGLFNALGFEEIDQAAVYRKDSSNPAT